MSEHGEQTKPPHGEQTELQSGGQTAPQPGEQAEPQSAEGNLTADCIKAVNDYRGENISKWKAVSQISAAIRSATASTDSEQRSSAGSTYLAMLDEHDRSLVDASTRGGQRVEQRTDESNEQEDFFNEEIGSKHTQLSRSGSPTSKRHKFTESLYAWKIQEEISPTTLSPNLERTR